MKHARRRAIAAGLVIVVAVTTLAAASLRPAGAQFSDTPPWAAAHIGWLAANGIAEGYPDGSFRPNLNITRAQAAFWFGNYNDSLQWVTKPTTFHAASNVFQADVDCPAGKRVLAGGGQISVAETFLTDSFPSPISTGRWVARWETDNDVNRAPVTVFVSALCGPDDLSL